MEHVYSLFLIIALVSFLGFLVENLWCALTEGYMDNRNMALPFLLGYGLAIVGIYLVLGTPRHLAILGHPIRTDNIGAGMLLYYLLVMLAVSLGEIILGKCVEKFCHIVWWDYTHLPLHITRYTSVPTSAGFALIISLFMDHVFEPLYRWNLTWPPILLSTVSVTLMLLLTVDFLRSGWRMLRKHELYQKWRIEFRRHRLHN